MRLIALGLFSFVWLVDPSGSIQILVSAPVVEGEKILDFSLHVAFFASFPSNPSFLRGELV